MESSWTWSSNCPLPPSPRAPRTWPRGLGQDRPCSKGPGGAGLTSESTSPHLEPRSGCQRASGGQRPALTVLVARKGSGSTVSQPAGGAGPGQRGVTRAGRPESGAPGQRPESDGGGAGPRGARGGAAAAHRPVPGHHGAGLLARRPGAGGGRVRTLLPPLPVRRSLRPGRGAARLRAFRARLPPDGRRRAVPGLGAAPRHRPRVLPASSCPRLLRGDGAGPARGLPRLPQRAAAAGVRAAPGGAAAGDAAPLPGQLRQVGPGAPGGAWGGTPASRPRPEAWTLREGALTSGPGPVGRGPWGRSAEPGSWQGPPAPAARVLGRGSALGGFPAVTAGPLLPCSRSLVATNAARLRLIAGPEKRLLELGLRRAQGPDGGLTASTYSYLGGFDGSSNVLAGQLRGVPVAGTLAHSFITSFSGTEVPPDPMLAPAAGQGPRVDLAACVETWLERVCGHLGLGVQEPHRGERAAFVAYALAFPRAFQGLLDTYSVRRSGLPNFLAVALALEELGYQAVGVRLDSGDLLQQAQETRGVFRTVAAQFRVPWLESIPIAVSNNIDEQELARLSQKGSEVNVIGIGTSVVTCPRQPSLGCVYKLVSVGGQPRMKLTEDPEKQTLPGSKAAFRLLGSDDVLQLAEEPPPQAGQELRVWPRGTQESCTVRPVHVEPLLRLWVQQGQLCEPLPSLAESRAFAQQSLSRLSPAHRWLEQPALYQVALSEKLRALVDRLSAEVPSENPLLGAA
ncbi:nicotinate phosphoribosyltransferase isoform X2 [Orcinus orca]|uniref:nicotinate phosphoribosyltransferase isoform X2 n=1 Tax=Orcinus orca TaxID=9733 RepID=UPI0021122F4D|nr:nicotinate phosphoribosyltransferase isoform X2 [Orcinus orca]